jgi:hypothetical protein
MEVLILIQEILEHGYEFFIIIGHIYTNSLFNLTTYPIFGESLLCCNNHYIDKKKEATKIL